MDRFIQTAAALFVILTSWGWAAAKDAASPTTGPSDQAAMEKRFEQTMTGVTMVGYFTITGQKDAPKEDSYVISKAVKGAGDNWTLTAKIGEKGNIELPISVPVKWAGDTPVISVTDLGLPGLGSYTARVVIYKDQYSGVWSAANHGGFMWGRLVHERAGATTAPSP